MEAAVDTQPCFGASDKRGTTTMNYFGLTKNARGV